MMRRAKGLHLTLAQGAERRLLPSSAIARDPLTIFSLAARVAADGSRRRGQPLAAAAVDGRLVLEAVRRALVREARDGNSAAAVRRARRAGAKVAGG